MSSGSVHFLRVWYKVLKYTIVENFYIVILIGCSSLSFRTVHIVWSQKKWLLSTSQVILTHFDHDEVSMTTMCWLRWTASRAGWCSLEPVSWSIMFRCVLLFFYELFDLDLTVCCFLTFRVNHGMRSEVLVHDHIAACPSGEATTLLCFFSLLGV